MLKVENITKEFTKKTSEKETITFLANDNISFTAKPGEVVGILGPNGAGKTTLLRIIAGIMEPSKGTVTIDDKTYKKDSIEIKKEITYLSGNTKLYKDISPYELLEMTASYYGLSKKEYQKKIKEISNKFNMTSFLHQRIGTLSTGQYQRTSISRCLIHNPKYYILDEPTSGLDVISSKTIIDFVKEMKKENKCILYSTHYMEEAENICDKIVMINKGKIIIEGSKEEILRKTKTTNLRDSFFALVGDNYE
ncbi:MAG: ABC transporter ATP-binding protein [Tenericutes bacterium]|nr:ABC transporter ATP-binding protein [Mycoplasmatota bacterium]